jgi:N-acetylated-alpha-linked acidic dipeptidase
LIRILSHALLLPVTALALLAQSAVHQTSGQGEPAEPSPAPAANTKPAANTTPAAQTPPAQPTVFGFRNFATQARWDQQFLAVPDPHLARQHLQVLTAAPHWASSPEDYATALYVAGRFKAAGLHTEIVPYSVLLNKPLSVKIEAFDASGSRILNGPAPEHADLPAGSAADAFQNDPRILPAYNDSSPSADITAPVVYANYGRLSDLQRLAALGISVKGKIVLVRYGAIYRGVKVYIAQQFGARGVLIYSDPADDGDRNPRPYPAGPDRPATAVQRGSVQFLPIYPGDPTTPGVASIPGLPASDRIPTNRLQYDLPSIPASPLSSQDAAPILRSLTGLEAPRDWQGGLDFPYHLGAGLVTVRMRLINDTRLRTIWDVIARIPGTAEPARWVIAGNHRDAWVYGASDPGSGTAALLEAVHGLGVLLQHGWRPRRTILLASWDAEEEGMIGSTEWVEQHSAELANAAAYFNIDVGVAGPIFNSAAVPSLRQFIRQIATEVPSPAGGTVFQQATRQQQNPFHLTPIATPDATPMPPGSSVPASLDQMRVGELGSGSDYTPFLQHAGVPSTDIASDGPFSVYHSVSDNDDWFTRFVDPSFAYTQQQARFLGLEVLHMADADILPYDYPAYAQAIRGYLDQAHNAAVDRSLNLDFTAAYNAVNQFEFAAAAMHRRQLAPPTDTAALDRALCAAERALLIPAGLPRRPWYRHSIYAPGEFTGYDAAVIPGVDEAIEASDPGRAQAQLGVLAQALNRAAATLYSAAP